MEELIINNSLNDKLTLVLTKLDSIEKRLCEHITPMEEHQEAKWLNVAELCEYLPSHPKVQTVYSWTCSRKIPFHKKGRSIMFDKMEIDQWLQDGCHYKTEQDLKEEAIKYIESKRKKSY